MSITDIVSACEFTFSLLICSIFLNHLITLYLEINSVFLQSFPSTYLDLNNMKLKLRTHKREILIKKYIKKIKQLKYGRKRKCTFIFYTFFCGFLEMGCCYLESPAIRDSADVHHETGYRWCPPFSVPEVYTFPTNQHRF